LLRKHVLHWGTSLADFGERSGVHYYSRMATLVNAGLANNHCAGFGSGTVNIFRTMLGLPEARWEEKKEERERPAFIDS
jgi:hypothetical protein